MANAFPMKRPNRSKAKLTVSLLLLSAGVGLWLGRDAAQPKPRSGEALNATEAVDSAFTAEHSSSQDSPEHLQQSASQAEDKTAIPNEAIVSFANQSDYQAFLASNNDSFKIISSNDTLRSVRIQVPNGTDLSSLPPNAQTDFNYTLLTPLPIITDTQASDKAFAGSALGFMNALDGNEQAGKGVKVAVLDSGIRNHSAIDPTRLENVGYSNSENLLSHGTSVASLIAGQDGIGIAPQAELIGIQVLDTDGIGDTFTLAEGIVLAVDSGANIINMSLGSYGTNLALENAISYAASKDVVLVASAGNESVATLPYPAAYQAVIAVAAIDADAHPTSFSNQSNHVDIAAPGVGVYAAWEEDKWISFSGTSASAPYVSGAIAAISSEMEVPASEAAQILLANTNDSGLPGTDSQLGRGYIDLDRSLKSDTTYTDLALADIYLDPNLDENGQNTVYITAQNRGTETIPTASLSYTLPNGITQEVYLGTLEPGSSGNYSLTLDNSELSGGYDVSARTQLDSDTIESNDSKEALVVRPEELPSP